MDVDLPVPQPKQTPLFHHPIPLGAIDAPNGMSISQTIGISL